MIADLTLSLVAGPVASLSMAAVRARPSHLHNHAIQGFTLIEIAIVIAVMLGLLALALPTLAGTLADSRETGTRAVVLTVHGAIANDPRKVWQVENSGVITSYRIWDVNQDGLVDGDPSLEDADPAYPAAVTADDTYQGLVKMLRPVLPETFVNDAAQPIDAWGRPLRIAYKADIYGAVGVGIWSAGADGIDGTYGDDSDDIRSWEAASDD